MPPQDRVVLLVDLDYFFAQCEELRNPELENKPVVIGMYSGRTEDSGAVSTANYVARKHGVRSGMPLFLAKKRLEGTEPVFLPVDYDFYQQVSDKIMRIIRGYADAFEQVGIDEAYLDVTQRTQRSFEQAKDLVAEIKAAVKREVGVTFSVGIGPNRLIAKIASDMHKPDGITVVLPQEVEAFLSPLPVDALLGVGRKISQRMEQLRIKTIGDLARHDVQELVEIFGKTLGVYFHNAANGVDNTLVQEAGEAESISRISTLKQNTRDITLIMQKADEQIAEIEKELVSKTLAFKSVGIIAVSVDLSMKSRSRALDKPTRDIQAVRRVVQDLFEKFLDESNLEIRRIGVKVSQFAKEENQQQQLTDFFGHT